MGDILDKDSREAVKEDISDWPLTTEDIPLLKKYTYDLLKHADAMDAKLAALEQELADMKKLRTEAEAAQDKAVNDWIKAKDRVNALEQELRDAYCNLEKCGPNCESYAPKDAAT